MSSSKQDDRGTNLAQDTFECESWESMRSWFGNNYFLPLVTLRGRQTGDDR